MRNDWERIATWRKHLKIAVPGVAAAQGIALHPVQTCICINAELSHLMLAALTRRHPPTQRLCSLAPNNTNKAAHTAHLPTFSSDHSALHCTHSGWGVLCERGNFSCSWTTMQVANRRAAGEHRPQQYMFCGSACLARLPDPAVADVPPTCTRACMPGPRSGHCTVFRHHQLCAKRCPQQQPAVHASSSNLTSVCAAPCAPCRPAMCQGIPHHGAGVCRGHRAGPDPQPR
jgi:hypothetical protein